MAEIGTEDSRPPNRLNPLLKVGLWSTSTYHRGLCPPLTGRTPFDRQNSLELARVGVSRGEGKEGVCGNMVIVEFHSYCIYWGQETHLLLGLETCSYHCCHYVNPACSHMCLANSHCAAHCRCVVVMFVMLLMQDPLRSFTGIDKYWRLKYPADCVTGSKIVRPQLVGMYLRSVSHSLMKTFMQACSDTHLVSGWQHVMLITVIVTIIFIVVIVLIIIIIKQF
jgi:hypothetical protein